MRAPRRATTGSNNRRRVAAAVALLAALSGAMTVLSGPATAGPVDTGWAANGTGTTTLVSDGTDSAAAFTYNGDGFGSGAWTFTATATPTSAASPIKVPWTWSGLHAWFQVTAGLETFVIHNGVTTTTGTLVAAGPEICCTSPSNGFLYGGIASFIVSPGDTYGFRLTGSNSDYNNFLRGTFTLSTKPYIDATIGTDNREWVGATVLPAGGLDEAIKEAGEARWYKIPVVPGQKVTVNLTNLPGDYDVALYGNIEEIFNRLTTGSDETQLAASSSAPAAGDGTVDSAYPTSIQNVSRDPDEQPSTTFAPRIYAPRIYAPRIYAPRIYAPRIYAPRIYAPRIYAPDSYVPDLASDPAFRDAFSAAQTQALLGFSANPSTNPEIVTASTGNTTPADNTQPSYFYVRVQGHTDQAFDAVDKYHVQATVTGGEACQGLTDKSDVPTLAATSNDRETVILTDSQALGLADDSAEETAYLGKLGDLAAAWGGAVVNVADSQRVVELREQVASHPTCPYATNLVGAAIRQIANSYRNANSKYVVIAGGDEVIPFFRYPDTSGLGQEDQFDPPMLDDSPAGASLSGNQVLSQDAYGSRTDVTIGGATIPVSDLAVGRLVKTPGEIESTITHFLDDLDEGVLPLTGAHGTSLVTGYDFLTDAAEGVRAEFSAALPGSSAADDLIAPADQPHETSWTADDLYDALVTKGHHDLVYLAGHFSALDTLAADFTTSLPAADLDPTAAPAALGALTDSLVLSAGCHSGYNIVDDEADPVLDTTVDWAQTMARQHAVLIGGTGFQYGDTDFREYSERLYLDVARRLHEGPTTGTAPVVDVGNALTLAKQDYLASLPTLTGVDQKAVLQATLYGLPMTGFDAPGRQPLGGADSAAAPEAVDGGPGLTFGLLTDDVPFTTPTTEGHKAQADEPTLPDQLTWLNGKDGVTVQPGAPALPKQVENVTVAGQVLRGVGFTEGDYVDSNDMLPLTGAPAIESSTANSTFDSPAFFPQELATGNYFGALGASGRTSLILTPGQYRNDDSSGRETDIQRAYSRLKVRLFYSPGTSTGTGANLPTLAAPPSIGAVSGIVNNGVVTFSTTVTGDPSAGVQQVWVTWTAGPGADHHGTWRSVDLAQDPNDSTRWTGTLDLQGADPDDVRFLVQAANGVGAVSLDTAEGDGYRPSTQNAADTAHIDLTAGSISLNPPYGVTAVVKDSTENVLPGRTVLMTVSTGGQERYSYFDLTDENGGVTLKLPTGQSIPSGVITVTAEVYGTTGQVVDTDTVVLDTAKLTLTNGAPELGNPLGFSVKAMDLSGSPVVGRTVHFVVTRNDVELYHADVETDGSGNAVAPLESGITTAPAGEIKIVAQLMDVSGQNVQDTVSATKTIAGVPVTLTNVSPDRASTRADTTYALAAPISATVTDAYGPVPFYLVTFGFPTSGASATFTPQGGASAVSQQISTNESGVATVPSTTVVKAGPTVGTFWLTVSAASATSKQVPFAAQYGFAAFVSPVGGTTTTSPTGTTPVKIAALEFNGAKITDATGTTIAGTNRFQIRWRLSGSEATGAWIDQRNTLTTYDTARDFFQTDLKASSLGWAQGKTYIVQVRILPAAGSPQPTPAQNLIQGTFDLGTAQFTITVNKK